MAVHARESIRDVVDVSVGDGCWTGPEHALGFGQSVPHCIIGIAEVATIGIVRFGEAVEWIIRIRDNRRDCARSRHANVRGLAALAHSISLGLRGALQRH